MKVLTVLFLSIAFPLAAQDPASADEILGKVVEKYKSAKSFSAEADCVDMVNKTRYEKTAKYWFKQPEFLRVDSESRVNFGAMTSSTAVGTYSIFSRKGEAYTYQKYSTQSPGTFNKRKSAQMAMGFQAGVSSGLTQLLPSLLLGKSDHRSYSWVRGEDVQVDGQPCFNLSHVTKSTGAVQTQWAVSKESFELLQVTVTSKMSGSEVKKMMDEIEKSTGKMPWHMEKYEALENVTSTRYKNMKWNPKLKDADFDYPLPKDAKMATDDELLRGMKDYLKNLDSRSMKLSAESRQEYTVQAAVIGTKAQGTPMFDQDGILSLNYNSGKDWGCDLSLNFIVEKNEGNLPDLGQPKYLEFEVKADADTSFHLGICESGVGPLKQSSFKGKNGADGERYEFPDYKARGDWALVRYKLADAKIYPYWGNQKGNKTLDLQALQSLNFNIDAGQGWGTIKIRNLHFSASPSPLKAEKPVVHPATQAKNEAMGLDEDEVAALEKSIKKNPDDLEARSKLFIYYGSHPPRFNDPKGKATYAKYYFWFLEHHPDSTIFSDPSQQSLYPGMDPDFEKSLAAWEKAAREHPKNPRVLSNAALQHWMHDKDVIRYLEAAEAVDPENAEWFFQLGRYQLGCSDDFDDKVIEPVRSRYAMLQFQNGSSKSGAEKFPFQAWLGWAAWGAGESATAKASSQAALDTAGNSAVSEHVKKGDLLFSGHSVLGLLDLQNSKVKPAIKHLASALNSDVSLEILTSQFAFELPAALLKKGEKGPVLNYLQGLEDKLNYAPHIKNKVSAWIVEIKEGKKPELRLY